MSKNYLSKEEISSVILHNQYAIKDKEKVDFDFGRAIRSAATSFGFEIDEGKVEVILQAYNLFTKGSNYSHEENLIALQIIGNFNLPSTFVVESEEGKISGKFYIYHQTIVHNLFRKIIQDLISQKAVKLFPGCDAEYLYEVLSSAGEELFYESVRSIKKNTVLYTIEFDEVGSFKIEEMGAL